MIIVNFSELMHFFSKLLFFQIKLVTFTHIRSYKVFPIVGSLIRLLSSVLISQNEEWITGRRYLKMDVEKYEEMVV